MEILTTPQAQEVFEAQQLYIEVLEKTNQQMSTWYAPMGVAVAILTGLIAFLTIVAAVVVWWQSVDYKRSFKKFLDDQRQKADATLDSLRKDLDERVAKVIENAENATEQQQQEARVELEQLQKMRQALNTPNPLVITGGAFDSTFAVGNRASSITGISSDTGTGVGGDPNILAGSYANIPRCSRCGTAIFGQHTYCPYCMNIL